MSQEEKIPFLVMQKYHLSREKARMAVVRTLQAVNVTCPKTGWDSLALKWDEGESQSQSLFSDLVNEARTCGVIKRLQRYLDRKDSVFGGLMEDSATPNWQMKWGTSFAGFAKEVHGPCRTSCVESELVDDILEYRQQACQYSSEYDFRLTCRAFRSYLSACVSLIDAFINRHILLAVYEGFSSPEFEQLKVATKFEDRVRLWFSVCSDSDASLFFKSVDWCHCQEIRKKRNEILHAVDPISHYSIEEIQQYLNKVRTGIGGLLMRMRTAHKKPTVGFIERLRTAPLVDFQKITFRADGNHKIKHIVGK